jgi:hypothetical protein
LRKFRDQQGPAYILGPVGFLPGLLCLFWHESGPIFFALYLKRLRGYKDRY